jgi:hypothetical protein
MAQENSASVSDEIWKPYNKDSRYSISSRGRIRCVDGTIKKIVATKDGYLCCSLAKRNLFVHRLVAEHFLPNNKQLSDVHHKDGNPSNNNVENLEWTNHLTNCARRKKQKKNCYKIKSGKYKVDITRHRIHYTKLFASEALAIQYIDEIEQKHKPFDLDIDWVEEHLKLTSEVAQLKKLLTENNIKF